MLPACLLPACLLPAPVTCLPVTCLPVTCLPVTCLPVPAFDETCKWSEVLPARAPVCMSRYPSCKLNYLIPILWVLSSDWSDLNWIQFWFINDDSVVSGSDTRVHGNGIVLDLPLPPFSCIGPNPRSTSENGRSRNTGGGAAAEYTIVGLHLSLVVSIPNASFIHTSAHHVHTRCGGLAPIVQAALRWATWPRPPGFTSVGVSHRRRLRPQRRCLQRRGAAVDRRLLNTRQHSVGCVELFISFSPQYNRNIAPYMCTLKWRTNTIEVADITHQKQVSTYL